LYQRKVLVSLKLRPAVQRGQFGQKTTFHDFGAQGF